MCGFPKFTCSAGGGLFDIDLMWRCCPHLSEKCGPTCTDVHVRMTERLVLPSSSLKAIIVVPVASSSGDPSGDGACMRPSFKGVVAILDPVLPPSSGSSFLDPRPSVLWGKRGDRL